MNAIYQTSHHCSKIHKLHGFETLAFSDKATCSQRKVNISCLTYVNKSGHASPTPNSDGLLSLERSSKLDPDLHGTCVLPCQEFDAGIE